jgi:hypothetical protein
MEELLATESTYVADLKKLFTRYIEPVTRDADIIPKDEQAIIFSVRFLASNSSIKQRPDPFARVALHFIMV